MGGTIIQGGDGVSCTSSSWYLLQLYDTLDALLGWKRVKGRGGRPKDESRAEVC